MLTAVLFDMDGLIFDTESVYKLSWQYAAKEQNLSISDDLYQQFIGVQDSKCEKMLSEYFQNTLDLPRFKNVRDNHFNLIRDNGITLKPGFDMLFKEIKQRGLSTAIVTSSRFPEVARNFSQTNYLPQFDLVITAEDVTHGKPSPDCYKLAYTQLGLTAKECLVLEDSNNGVKAALSAGCHTIMVPDLLPPQTELTNKAMIVEDLAQVVPLLDSF
ncbi:HAD family hydrolase [Vibrio sp. M260118]|uniref:HAD family hydrolase n=1 Tax=Vibrio sp. M260118 TaxID=3020896 RepID=UPI002F403017